MDRLEKEGFYTKSMGAVKAKEKYERTFEQKTSLNNIEICKRTLLSIVEDGDVIFIGHGTTAYEIVRYLGDKPNVIVVTNSLPVLSLAAECFQGKVLFAGGEYEHRQNLWEVH